MPSTKQNQQVSPSIRPEAELESRMAAALSAAFPNIPREQLVEQRRFTVRLGHETHSTALPSGRRLGERMYSSFMVNGRWPWWNLSESIFP